MARVRVKFCGITRPQDAREAARLGADAVGLVFYRESPRAVTLEQARAVVEALPPFVCKVAVFVDAAAEEVEAVLRALPIDLLQFHGEESPASCARFGRPYLKAVRMRAGVDLRAEARRHPDCAGLLVDSYHETLPGGSGRPFDWSLIPREVGKPLVLAGGLTPANVAAAIRAVRPYAVDVSGGVEAAKGVKDPARMQAFMTEVLRES